MNKSGANKSLAVLTGALLLTTVGAALVSAPSAHADIPPNCQAQPWGFLGIDGIRAICDDPIRPDGSWMRHRVIGHPAYWAKPSTHCSYGSYSSDCYYDEGGYVAETDSDDEWYPVTPDTVPPGEPGHLG